MNYSDLRRWLRDTLATVDGLEAYDRPPGTIVTPCVFPQRLVVDPRGGYDVERATVELALIVSRSDEESAWDLIDGYVTRGDPSCVVDALETTSPDGFDSLAVTGWEVVPDAVVNDIGYFAVAFTCEVLG